MKFVYTIIIPTLIMVTVMYNTANANIETPLSKIVNTEWVQQATLKYGMVGSICAAQTFTGLTEGYHWTRHSNHGGEYIVHSSNYHTYETMRRTSWIATGWFAYANIRDAHISKMGKIKRFIGAAFIGRNCFEWTYKWQRYNNPIDYSKSHNNAAIVYFGMRNGKITDLYIGTGPLSGPVVDICFLVCGILLLQD